MARKGTISLVIYPSADEKADIQAAAAECKMSVSKYILSRVRGEKEKKVMVAKPDRSLSVKEIMLGKRKESQARSRKKQ